ncbi:dihydropteroate synthase FolP [Gottschalkia purinilytica]|uniref:Dihydropteroate synthase n=1 Tax=Gottschalkia purinilytica TaxID=1503 RepID=A0A0L0WCL4_GOTPU|nr:dihydropteroate synthase [Gottschalkia purinilytica]KNF09201.1 dihydropteroate synthase FolP [Gottschalkia purinilytica]
MRNIAYRLNRKINVKCGDYELNLGTKTYVMGILNITPDSFSDGGNFFELENAIKHAKEMIEEGADIIDVGGESTRPGSEEVSAEDELERVLPVVKRLAKEVKAPISVDTYKAIVADKVLEAGAHIINDIWGLQKDPDMANVVAKYNVPVVIMHNQIGTEYKNDIMEEICRFLRKSIDIALKAGIKPENIILDPGIGFGKTSEQNMEVMARLGELNDLGYPILLGTSRKSMIGKILDLPSEERVEGTIATSVMGVIQASDIVRVHDIKENVRAIKVTDAIVRGIMPWTK